MAVVLATDIFDPRCLANSIMLPFTAISIPVYVIFFCALIRFRNTDLSGSFFTLHISIAIADLLSLIFGKFFFKFPVFCGLFPLGYDIGMRYRFFFGKLMTFMFWYTLHAQMFGVVAITINRFTAIVFPLKHSKIWSKRFLCLMICGMWSLPLVFSVLMLTTDVALRASFNSNGELRWYQYQYGNEWIETISFAASGIWIGIVLNVILFIMYLIQFIKYIQNRATLANSSLAAQTKACTELKLAFCGFVIFLVLSAYGLILLRMVIENLFGYYCNTCIHLYSVVGDISAWINPYILLAVSTQTRHCFLKTIGLGCICEKTIVVPLRYAADGALQRRRSMIGLSGGI